MEIGAMPMRACTLENIEDAKHLTYPLFVSGKIDGIRGVIGPNVVLSKSFKPIPNKHIQSILSTFPEGLDGEITVDDFLSPSCYKKSTSGVMSAEGKPDFTFHVFDNLNFKAPYMQVYLSFLNLLDMPDPYGYIKKHLIIVKQEIATSYEDLVRLEKYFLGLGYEGIMIKSMKGTYKYGKCTFKEENLFKFKRFTDSEARILEFVPQYKNFNAMERNELGYAKRSSRKENKVALDTLGALIVEDIYTGRTFTIGMGFDAKTKKDIWTNRFKYKGAIITYKFFDKGNYEKARHGVYKGFRSKLDLSI